VTNAVVRRLLYWIFHFTFAVFWMAVGALWGWSSLGTALWVGLMAFICDMAIYSLAKAMAGR
jgi:hypothetical protein